MYGLVPTLRLHVDATFYHQKELHTFSKKKKELHTIFSLSLFIFSYLLLKKKREEEGDG